ncbi:MAG: hypothetical protein SGJ13_07505, partial [Actinomycetota bacterium]|nr:hypothetical protein [Actinomycetota bacterium]
MPPLSPSDLDAISRTVEKIVDRKLESRLGPVEKRIEKHSGQYRELGPEVARKISESQHDIEDARLGFERFMMNAVGRVEAKADAIAKSIPPAASAANGAEAAAVAGAKAAVRVEGKTDAVQVAA